MSNGCRQRDVNGNCNPPVTTLLGSDLGGAGGLAGLMDGFDGSIPELLQLYMLGFDMVYPAQWASERGSVVGALAEQAIGDCGVAQQGTFKCEGDRDRARCGKRYCGKSCSGHFHYTDEGCDFDCLVDLYRMWGITSCLGVNDWAPRRDEVDYEWELCNATLVQARDPGLFALVHNASYALPLHMSPDGRYTPSKPPAQGLLGGRRALRGRRAGGQGEATGEAAPAVPAPAVVPDESPAEVAAWWTGRRARSLHAGTALLLPHHG